MVLQGLWLPYKYILGHISANTGWILAYFKAVDCNGSDEPVEKCNQWVQNERDGKLRHLQDPLQSHRGQLMNIPLIAFSNSQHKSWPCFTEKRMWELFNTFDLAGKYRAVAKCFLYYEIKMERGLRHSLSLSLSHQNGLNLSENWQKVQRSGGVVAQKLQYMEERYVKFLKKLLCWNYHIAHTYVQMFTPIVTTPIVTFWL